MHQQHNWGSMGFGTTEQEEKIQVLFTSLDADFKKLSKSQQDPGKTQAVLKDVTRKLKDVKT